MSDAVKTAKSSVIVLLTRLTEKLLGLISTLVITKFLQPEDFGLVAIAMLVMMFVDAMANIAGEMFIAQKEHVNNSDLNSAWTLNIVLKIALYLIILMITPLAAKFFNDERLIYVIPSLSMLLIINAFFNPWMMIFFKNNDFVPAFKVVLIGKVVAVVSGITIAVLTQSYWALIVSHLLSMFARCIYTYYLYPYLPSISFSQFSEQWGYFKWVIIKNIFTYLRLNADAFLIGRLSTPADLGGYNISKYISNMPFVEGVVPAMNPLVAAFCAEPKNIPSIVHKLRVSMVIILPIVFFISAFLFCFGHWVAELLLGDNWKNYYSFFNYLSLAGLVCVISCFPLNVLNALGMVKKISIYDFLGLGCVIVASFFIKDGGVLAFLKVKMGLDIILVVLFTIYAMLVINFPNKIIFLSFMALNVLVAYSVCQFIYDLFFEYSLLNLIGAFLVSTFLYAIVFCIIYWLTVRKTKTHRDVFLVLSKLIMPFLSRISRRIS